MVLQYQIFAVHSQDHSKSTKENKLTFTVKVSENTIPKHEPCQLNKLQIIKMDLNTNKKY
jgi:hypothetical protein